jgi:hypothetical protein
MDTTSIPPLTSIGIDIGKDVFHVVGFSSDAELLFVARSSDWLWSRPSKSCLRASLAWRRA